MEFRALGPLEIRGDDGRELPLGQGRERALLAILLLHPDEVVSLERIVDDLWRDEPPPTAGKIVRNYVSHLRRLVDGRLLTAGRGYRLQVAPADVDVARFESLVARGRRELEAGRPGEAAETLAEALSLWRGPPFAEFALEEFALGDIARLEELRSEAIEDRIDAQLALGGHAEVVPELEELVERFPLRERPRRQLMLALYRSGRQADALEEYRRARAILVGELGLEPTDELRELEHAILAHDPSLAPPAVPPPGAAPPGARPSPRLLRPRVLALVGLVLVLGAGIAAAVRLLGAGRSAPSGPVADAVAVVDPASGRLVGRLAVGERPVAVAVGDGSVWVANADDGTVSKIDPRTEKVVATIGLGVPASDIAVGGGWVWVVSGSEGTLERIDPRTDTAIQTIDLAGPDAVAPSGAYCIAVRGRSVWVGSASRRIYRVDTRSGAVTARIPVSHIPAALDVGREDVWAALIDERTVRIDAATGAVTGTVAGPRAPTSLVLGAGGVWVGDEYGAVWHIDPATVSVSGTTPVRGRPLGLAVDGRDLWVAAPETRALTRIDERSGKVVGSTRLGGAPLDVAVGAGAVWVTLGPAGS